MWKIIEFQTKGVWEEQDIGYCDSRLVLDEIAIDFIAR